MPADHGPNCENEKLYAELLLSKCSMFTVLSLAVTFAASSSEIPGRLGRFGICDVCQVPLEEEGGSVLGEAKQVTAGLTTFLARHAEYVGKPKHFKTRFLSSKITVFVGEGMQYTPKTVQYDT